MPLHQSVLRFALEIIAWVAIYQGFGMIWGLSAIALWGAFGVDGNPTRGRPWILVGGKLRLLIELVVFGAGLAGFLVSGRTEIAAVYLLALVVHNVWIRKRNRWLWYGE